MELVHVIDLHSAQRGDAQLTWEGDISERLLLFAITAGCDYRNSGIGEKKAADIAFANDVVDLNGLKAKIFAETQHLQYDDWTLSTVTGSSAPQLMRIPQSCCLRPVIRTALSPTGRGQRSTVGSSLCSTLWRVSKITPEMAVSQTVSRLTILCQHNASFV